MGDCLNCRTEIKQSEGKREKLFCSDKCRASYWQKNKKKDLKYVHYKTFKELEEKYHLLLSKINPTEVDIKANKKLNEGVLEPVVETKPPLSDYEIKMTAERIKVLEHELANPVSNPLIGKKAWISLRESELANLKSKLNEK